MIRNTIRNTIQNTIQNTIRNTIQKELGDDAFNMLDLFSGGQRGVWYDPSDLSTLFQDSAGTIPATSDGQPVGLMLDKSGNGNHARQTVSTRRPTYKTDGVLHWLEFDGVDDFLETVNNHPFTFTGAVSCLAGFEKVGAPNRYETVLSAGAVGSPADNTYKSMAYQINDDGNGRLATDIWSPSGVHANTVLSSDTAYLAYWGIKNWSTHKTSGDTSIRLNGVDDGATSYGSSPLTSLNVGNMKVGVFDSVLPASYFVGNLYSLVVTDDELTSYEYLGTEQYIAEKAGVTI